MIEKRNWDEFRNVGLLFIVNQLLHIFGWAIVFKIENEKIIEVFPARVKYRGFGEEETKQGYIKISRWMKDNASELLIESES